MLFRSVSLGTARQSIPRSPIPPTRATGKSLFIQSSPYSYFRSPRIPSPSVSAFAALEHAVVLHEEVREHVTHPGTVSLAVRAHFYPSESGSLLEKSCELGVLDARRWSAFDLPLRLEGDEDRRTATNVVFI